jgi:hypothetical protein
LLLRARRAEPRARARIARADGTASQVSASIEGFGLRLASIEDFFSVPPSARRAPGGEDPGGGPLGKSPACSRKVSEKGVATTPAALTSGLLDADQAAGCSPTMLVPAP